MLRITTQKSAAQVKDYFKQSDYYQDGPNALKGYWHGKGATKLGLTGEVNKALFDRVVDNEQPFTPENLTPRTQAQRRIGWDFTFNAPKSVSIAWAVTQDHRILDGLRESVNETLDEIEKGVLTRVHAGKEMHTEKTGNIIAATWLHTTARQVDGNIPMPHLHIHAWLANATHDGKRFKAMDISAVKKDGAYFEARFHHRLAEKLQEKLGIAIERQGKKWFEIAGFPRDVIEQFSERTMQIEKVAMEKGITDTERKSELGAKTRQKKIQVVPPEKLPGLWQEKLGEERIDAIEKAMHLAADNQVVTVSPKRAVDYALDYHFSDKSTVRERNLLTEAIWHGIGQVPLGAIEEEYQNRPLIRAGKEEASRATTKTILNEERQLLAFAREGLGSVMPLASGRQISRNWLGEEQKRAIERIWNQQDRVMIVSGKAGTGKSTLATEAIEGIRKNGTSVTVLAPTTKAVDVLKKDGFDAKTLAGFLKNATLQDDAAGGVLFLDEAGLVSTRDMVKLFRLADKLDARLILSGDTRQYKAVEYGQPLKLLEEESGIKPIKITKIRRQEDEKLLKAVEHLSEGKVYEGLRALWKMDAIHILPDEKRNKELASRFADAIGEGESALVVSPTHAERREVTESIRKELRSREMISSDEMKLQTLRPYQWKKAERQDAIRYTSGDIVEFHARGKNGFRPGDRAKVIGIEGGNVMVEKSGTTAELPLSSAGAFSVYRPEEQGFAKGDVIRITKNRRAKEGQSRLTNGNLYKVQGFTKDGKLRLGGGLNIDSGWGHFDHAVVMTGFSSQGETVDHVFIAQSSKSFPASSPEQIYVSTSRPRKSLHLYSDDRSGLFEATAKERPEQSATELSREAKRALPPSKVKQRIGYLQKAGLDISRRFKEQVQRMRQWFTPQVTHAAKSR